MAVSRFTSALALSVALFVGATVSHCVACEWTTAGPEREADRLLSLRQTPPSEDDVIKLRLTRESHAEYAKQLEDARSERAQTRRLGIDSPDLSALEDYAVDSTEQQMLIAETEIKLLELNVNQFFGLYARTGTRRDAALTIGVVVPALLLAASLGAFVLARRKCDTRHS